MGDARVDGDGLKPRIEMLTTCLKFPMATATILTMMLAVPTAMETMLAMLGAAYEWIRISECPTEHASALAARPRVWYVGWVVG